MNEFNRQEDENDYRKEIIRRYMEIILYKLIRNRPVDLKEFVRPKTRQTCALVRQYIDSHFNRAELSLESLANMFHLNKFYLVHTFTKEFGISPVQYINSRRIAESQQLLANTNYSVSLIAELNGFSSPSYFSQSFQRAVKQSPMQYRKMMQTGNS
jgi:AraC-like DNA-binding protein